MKREGFTKLGGQEMTDFLPSPPFEGSILGKKQGIWEKNAL